METLQCLYDKTLFKNFATYETCFTATLEDGKSIKCVGVCDEYETGIPLIIQGEFENGEFKATSIVESTEGNSKFTYMYLKSKLFPNVSARMALKISALIGNKDIFDFILEKKAIEKIMECTKKDYDWANSVISRIADTAYHREILSEIKTVNGTISEMLNLYTEFGKDTVKKLKKDPYIACEKKVMSFPKCDLLAAQYELSPYSKKRKKYILKTAMQMVKNSGSTRTSFDNLYKKAFYVMRQSAYPDCIISKLELLAGFTKDIFYIDDNWIYFKSDYYRERSIAINVKRLFCNRKKYEFTEEQIQSVVEEFDFSDDKTPILRNLANGGVMIVTGGPGTGKTWTVKGIIKLLKLANPYITIRLAATTGCAAQNLKECDENIVPSTVHKTLGLVPDSEDIYTAKDLHYDVILIDEYSMADNELTYHLMKYAESGTMIILVGDINQVKSVGAGQVFKDFIDSGLIPTFYLKRVHRQDDSASSITNNAMLVNAGVTQLYPDNKSFLLYKCKDETDAKYIFNWYYDNFFRKLKDTDYMFLSPSKIGVTGCNELNVQIHDSRFANMNKHEITYGIYHYCVGDRVLITTNHYEAGNDYYNGDTGTIMEFDAKSVKVMLDRHEIVLVDDLSNIVPAYFRTIHKAQGSEAPYVLIILSRNCPSLLTRDILYTGMTRAKRQLIIIDVDNAMTDCITNIYYRPRETGLQDQLKKHVSAISKVANYSLEGEKKNA